MRRCISWTGCFWSLLVLFAVCLVSENVYSDIVSFQQGVDGYSSVRDTYLQNNLGPAHTSEQLYVRLGDNAFSTRNSLIVFDDIFGFDSSQIPVGSSIVSATLEFQTRNQSDAAGGQVNFHRMLMEWDQTDVKPDYGMPPWNNQDWVQADNFEASSTIGGTFLPDQVNTLYQIDVTNDVQLWANGMSNFGWAMLADPNADDDNALFFSSDYSTISSRPRLIVEFSSVPEPGVTGALLLGMVTLLMRRKRRQPLQI